MKGWKHNLEHIKENMNNENEFCGKTGCKCHNWQDKKEISFFGKFTIAFLWIFILFNIGAGYLNTRGIIENNTYSKMWQNRLTQPIQFVFPDFSETIGTSYESSTDDISPIVRLTIVSEKQKYFCSKLIDTSGTLTEILPDGTEVTIGTIGDDE